MGKSCCLAKNYKSEICKKYKDAFAGLTIGRIRFREFICLYIEKSAPESYVDVPISVLSEFMVFLGTAARNYLL